MWVEVTVPVDYASHRRRVDHGASRAEDAHAVDRRYPVGVEGAPADRVARQVWPSRNAKNKQTKQRPVDPVV